MSTYKFNNALILVFAKQPVAGKVKTRMIPRLDSAAALALHKELIELVCKTVIDSGLCPLQIWVTAGREEAFFQSLARPADLFLQQGDDLGARMAHAASTALQTVESVVIIGADCPSVDAAYLDQALTALHAGEEIVIGPAEDGGYVLLGLRRLSAALFRDIDWGSAAVMQQTRQALTAAGERWQELPLRWDVDRPEDLARYERLKVRLK
ncbi:MAG: TIGR04282 family arsenosugar biosynthesis glycosyltransferase [Pseudomonadales bacterium]|nr:TIGR04282 family arsenosugar biosynthesis glycosyltransferase [Pseudomonadales bacterium]